MDNISVLIIAFNERIHIERCLKSLLAISDDIVVIDSYSTDDTQDICLLYNVRFYQNKFINHSSQINWALENVTFKNEWILRLDADEITSSKFREEVLNLLSRMNKSVNGITVNRQYHFFNKFIKHGGQYPTKVLRIWRKGFGICESKWMDEHIMVKGEIRDSNLDIKDINLNPLEWWIEKHNKYSSREALEELFVRFRIEHDNPKFNDYSKSLLARRKNFIKSNVFVHLPLLIKSTGYFLYRYFVLGGFRDGKVGLYFHILHSFWYRYLVSLKTWRVESLIYQEKLSFKEAVSMELKIDL